MTKLIKSIKIESNLTYFINICLSTILVKINLILPIHVNQKQETAHNEDKKDEKEYYN